MSGRVLDADVGIVGAGPAGMAAAKVCAQAGLTVVVLDEGHRAGGQIFRQLPFGASAHAIAEPPSCTERDPTVSPPERTWSVSPWMTWIRSMGTPVRSDTNAICCPSGEYAGLSSKAALLVRGAG